LPAKSDSETVAPPSRGKLKAGASEPSVRIDAGAFAIPLEGSLAVAGSPADLLEAAGAFLAAADELDGFEAAFCDGGAGVLPVFALALEALRGWAFDGGVFTAFFD